MGNTATRAGWTRVRFGDVVRLSTERCTDPVAAGIDRYVGLEHLEPGDLRIRAWGNVADGVTFTNRFRPGQVLFGKRRAYQRKVAVAEFDGICSSDIYVFEPADERLLPELLPFICQTDSFFEHALKTSAGSLSPRTNWTSLADFEFDLPPPADQRSLSHDLEAASDCINAHASVVDCTRVLVRSSLTSVFQLDGVRRREQVRAPSGWRLMKLDELTDPNRPISYGVLKPGSECVDGVPMLRVMDFDEFGRRSSTRVYRVAKTVADTSKTTYCRANDLVVSIMATIGRTFVTSQDMNGWNMNRALALVPCNNPRLAAFLHAYFQSGAVQQLLCEEKIGSAQPRINLSDLKTLPVPVPPELDTVLSVIGDVLDTLTSAENRLGDTRRIAGTLMKTVLA